MSKFRMHLLVCGVATGCFGFCEKGPIVKVHPDNVLYVEVKPDDVTEIINEHVIKGRVVERLEVDAPAVPVQLVTELAVRLVHVEPVDASAFDAIVATGAILTPVDDAEGGLGAPRCCASSNALCRWQR